jgi:hypothetical protein
MGPCFSIVEGNRKAQASGWGRTSGTVKSIVTQSTPLFDQDWGLEACRHGC